MYILLSICEKPGLLRIIYFIYLLMNIIFTIVPIGLIVMLLIDFSKALISADDVSSSKDMKTVGQRIISAFLLFITPWIVETFMTFMDSIGFDSEYSTCLKSAMTGDFTALDKIYSESHQVAKIVFDGVYKMINKNDDGNSGLLDYDNSIKMADRMIEVASGEIGKNNNSGKYGYTGAPWCAMFASWVMENTTVDGVNLAKDIVQKEHKDPNRAGAACTMYAFKNSSHLNFHYSRYYAPKYNKSDISYIPKKGDLVYFDWNGDWNGTISSSCAPGATWIDHIGIVEYVKDGVVYTVEGNTSKKVGKRNYSLDSKVLIGFGSWYSNSSSSSTSNNNNNTNNTSDSATIKSDIENYIKSKNYDISVGYYNLKTGESYVYNDKDYYGASTIKTLDALYIYDKDKSMLNDGTRELVKKAITVSDNNSHIALVNKIGLDNYRNYAKELGVSNSIYNTIGNESGHYGNTNVATQFIYLKKLYSVINEGKDGATLKSYYVNNYYNCLEYQNSPTTMHKYGWLDVNFHDVGIVLDNNPYIVVILTNGANNDANCGANGGKSSSSAVTELSKKIYQLHQSLMKE